MILESLVLGTSGSLPLPYRNLTSVLIRREGEDFLFDCGECLQVSLRQAHVRWKNIKVICISHSHADHVTGLPGLLMLSAQAQRTLPLLIVCPYAVKEFVEQTIENLGIYINYEIQFLMLEDIDEGIILQTDEYELRTFRGNHTRNVWGFILEEYTRAGKFFPEKALELKIPVGKLWSVLQKGMSIEVEGHTIEPQQVMGDNRLGRKISYVTDTRPMESISLQIANSDLVFCESMFQHQHLAQAIEKKHMTGVEAAQMIANAGNILRAGLLHFSPRYSQKGLQEIEQEAKKIFPNIFLCQERELIPIPYRDN